MQDAIRGYPSPESKRRLQHIVISLAIGAFLLMWALSIAPVIPIILRARGSRLELSKSLFVLCYGISLVLQFILPTILGAILAGPMRRHRLSEVAPGTTLAPLWRRGLAKAIDATIILGPAYVGQAMLILSWEPEMSRIGDFPRAGVIASIMGLVLAIS